MPRLVRLLPAALATSALLLAACGGDSPTAPGGGAPVRYGTSNSTVTGGLSTTFGGVAVYGRLSAQAGSQQFQLAMGSLAADSTFDNVVVIARANGATPPAASHAIVDLTDGEPAADAFTLVAVIRSGAGATAMRVCIATEGSLRVESVAGGRVRGSYTAAADCADPAGQGAASPVSLAGSFDAVEGSRLVTLPGS